MQIASVLQNDNIYDAVPVNSGAHGGFQKVDQLVTIDLVSKRNYSIS